MDNDQIRLGKDDVARAHRSAASTQKNFFGQCLRHWTSRSSFDCPDGEPSFKLNQAITFGKRASNIARPVKLPQCLQAPAHTGDCRALQICRAYQYLEIQLAKRREIEFRSAAGRRAVQDLWQTDGVAYRAKLGLGSQSFHKQHVGAGFRVAVGAVKCLRQSQCIDGIGARDNDRGSFSSRVESGLDLTDHLRGRNKLNPAVEAASLG